MKDNLSGKKTKSHARETYDYKKKGETLFIFKPQFYYFNILLWIVLAVIVLGASMFYLQELSHEPNTWMFIFGFFFMFPACFILIYITYINTFDNIIIFEKGLYPPQGSEGLKNMFLMRRTFISFSEVEHFDLVNWSRGIVMVAKGRIWRIFGNWDLIVIFPIIQAGINTKFLVPPPFHKNSAAQTQIR